MVAVSGVGAWVVRTALLPLSVNGAGDAVCALFLAHYLRSGDPAVALSKATSSVYAVLEATARAGTREIRLVESQEAIADPPDRFPARRVR
jgi:pyridoxine kinase